MGWLDTHLDAFVTGGITVVGAVILYAVSVGKMQQALREIEQDIQEIKGGVRRTNKRFHWLSDYSMNLYALIRVMGVKIEVPIRDLKGYNFEAENGDEEEGGSE